MIAWDGGWGRRGRCRHEGWDAGQPPGAAPPRRHAPPNFPDTANKHIQVLLPHTPVCQERENGKLFYGRLYFPSLSVHYVGGTYLNPKLYREKKKRQIKEDIFFSVFFDGILPPYGRKAFWQSVKYNINDNFITKDYFDRCDLFFTHTRPQPSAALTGARVPWERGADPPLAGGGQSVLTRPDK